MYRTLVLVACLMAGALSAHSQGLTFQGIQHDPVGAAVLTEQNGRLKISNLGSSGCDGVSISGGGGGGFEITSVPFAFQSGLSLELGASDASGTGICNFTTEFVNGRYVLRAGSGTSHTGGGSGGAVWLEVQLQDDFGNPIVGHEMDSTTPISFSSQPVSMGMGSEWTTDANGEPRLTPYYYWRVTAGTDVQLSPQGPPLLCASVRVRVSDLNGDGLNDVAAMHLTTSGFAQPFPELEVVSSSLLVHGNTVDAVGDVHVFRSDGQDNDCDGVCDQNCDDGDPFTSTKLKISNLGSSGCDGVSIANPDGNPLDVPFRCPDGRCVDESGSSFTIEGDVRVTGTPVKVSGDLIVQAGGVLRMTWDNSAGFGQSVAISRDGQVVATFANATELEIDGGNNQNWDFGSMGVRGDGSVVVSLDMPDGVTVRDPVHGDLYICDTNNHIIRVSMPGIQDDDVVNENVSLLAGGGGMCQLDIEGIRKDVPVSLDGLPPGEPVIRTLSGEGTANTVPRLDSSGALTMMVDNLGSSGCDGVSIDINDGSGTAADRFHTLWDPVTHPSGAPNATMTLGFGSRVTGAGSGGRIALRASSGVCLGSGDFSSTGATQVRVVAMLDGAVVANVVRPNSVDHFELPDWPSGAGYESLGGGSGGAIYMTFRNDDHIWIFGGTNKQDQFVQADALQILPEDPTSSSSFETFSVLAGGLPFVEFTKFSAESPAEPVPVAVREFAATAQTDGVHLRWQIQGDLGELRGLRILRREGAEWSPIHDGLLLGDRGSFLDRQVGDAVELRYRLALVAADGSQLVGDEIAVKTAPSAFALLGNAPNPFNPSTTIHFSLATRETAMLTIHDMSGRLVATLANEVMNAGPHSVQWLGLDDNGRPVASGNYFYRLASASGTRSEKLTLLK